jgi:hypothetical protein
MREKANRDALRELLNHFVLRLALLLRLVARMRRALAARTPRAFRSSIAPLFAACWAFLAFSVAAGSTIAPAETVGRPAFPSTIPVRSAATRPQWAPALPGIPAFIMFVVRSRRRFLKPGRQKLEIEKILRLNWRR